MQLELTVERLCASGEARTELVLLHGWGSSRACWRPLLKALRPWANVSLLDLPGLGGEGNPGDAATLARAVVDACPDGAVLVGWSLGGQIASLAAALAPEQIRALVTVASNPHFTAADGWPGVPAANLQQMASAHKTNPARSLERFEALQALGQPAAAGLRRHLAACRGNAAACASGLEWLARLDTRAVLAGLAQPQLHLLAGRDSLLPAELAAALAAQLQSLPGAVVRSLHEGGHALPLQCPQLVAAELEAFLQQQNLLAAGDAAGDAGVRLDKGAIAASFSRAASTYDSVAALQREVGERLLLRLPPAKDSVATVLDLGCGTGYFQPALSQRYPAAHYIGLDLASGMLDYARSARGTDARWVAGDAEQLPLAADSVDLVFSSLAIQWCQRPAALFAELQRVLRPGGLCLFSTLGPATLQELRSAWAAVDSGRHVNDFLPAAALEQAAGPALHLERELLGLGYARLRQLFDELKGIGAHNVHSQRPAGLGGRRALAGMMAAYEGFRSEGLLPATYEVFYGVFSKRGAGHREQAA
ncbi:malonyl-ACP O-methyltransferase BioC [Parahaliea aestuarii]|uniref:Malonyl-[acyl-carrier protein] O-methyltransferase n=1 Tax=Parahaliea aestuarii TaxID=1852021 RepID=A0A5C8ZY93_9GAMM|nr:malonyl-ACP O-methyltransferase BioC [Parahaliea aestuarii]TXS92221.1 malonyl-ACP O-methyltransferase BioC [Parahaliea aestuarii]